MRLFRLKEVKEDEPRWFMYSFTDGQVQYFDFYQGKAPWHSEKAMRMLNEQMHSGFDETKVNWLDQTGPCFVQCGEEDENAHIKFSVPNEQTAVLLQVDSVVDKAYNGLELKYDLITGPLTFMEAKAKILSDNE